MILSRGCAEIGAKYRMNTRIQKKVGQNIRRLRKARGMTQEILAAKLQVSGCDITRSAVAKIEVGARHLYPDEIIALREILRASYEEIFDISENWLYFFAKFCFLQRLSLGRMIFPEREPPSFLFDISRFFGSFFYSPRIPEAYFIDVFSCRGLIFSDENAKVYFSGSKILWKVYFLCLYFLWKVYFFISKTYWKV